MFFNFPIVPIEGLIFDIGSLVEYESDYKKSHLYSNEFIQPGSVATDAVIQTVEPEFIKEGDWYSCPIPRDAPNIKRSEFPTIEAIDGTKEEGDCEYDQSSNARLMMKGEGNYGHITHINIPFSSSSPMKGAYICLDGRSSSSPPSYLIFTLTSSKGEKTSKKYEFPLFRREHWYFLPVDLPDVVLCEITGKGREEEWFKILSLVFISREESPEEIKSREAKEKLWSETPVVKPEFVKKGGKNGLFGECFDRKSIPIPRDDPKLVDPSFSIVKCKNDAFSKESEKYYQSSNAQKMLKGDCYVEPPHLWWIFYSLTHLSIPFPSPSPMKGAYICVDEWHSSPSLLFTFTDYDGKKTSKNNNCRDFIIYSLVFLRGDDIPSPPLLTPVPVPSSSSKTPTSTLSLPSKHVKEEAVKEDVKEALPVKEEEEEKTESRGKKDIPSSSKQQTESLTQETKTSEPTKSNPIQPTSSTPSQHPIPVPLPQTLTSSCTITPLCIIGKGGFGVVILARVEYPASYCSPPVLCALKCMKNKESCKDNEKCVKYMKKEFSRQHRLYFKSSLQSCIPRPLHILDLLDGDLKGTFGMAMEFCQGGNVIDFAKSWAVDLDECDPCEDDEEDIVYDPVKLAALCVAIIECVATLCVAKKKLVHRDIKPDNFLVRYDALKKQCHVLLG
ncbi:hypothetical protein ADUPG1_012217, partial [Aduncisulcus paluster]